MDIHSLLHSTPRSTSPEDNPAYTEPTIDSFRDGENVICRLSFTVYNRQYYFDRYTPQPEYNVYFISISDRFSLRTTYNSVFGRGISTRVKPIRMVGEDYRYDSAVEVDDDIKHLLRASLMQYDGTINRRRSPLKEITEIIKRFKSLAIKLNDSRTCTPSEEDTTVPPQNTLPQ